MKNIILTESQFNKIIKQVVIEQSDEHISSKDLVELGKLKSYINGLKIMIGELNNSIDKYYEDKFEHIENKQNQVDALREIVNTLGRIEDDTEVTRHQYGKFFLTMSNFINDAKEYFK